jgi:hypothetical protein
LCGKVGGGGSQVLGTDLDFILGSATNLFGGFKQGSGDVLKI